MGGKSFNLSNDNDIIGLSSPKSKIGGPYTVVYKHIEERWAIVTLKWDGEPRVAIRWFWGNGGNPFSSGNPTWLVIPPTLSRSILAGLPLNHKVSVRIDQFLSGDLNGSDLASLED